MTVKDKEAYRKIERARTVMLVRQPFFGCLSLQLGMEERPDKSWWQSHGGTDEPTMAVDGRDMFYYPKFVHDQSEEELVGVLAHEVMHCAWKHMSRRGHRHPVIWNWAGDFVINDLLLQAGFTLPEMKLHDKKYENMSTEEVYERIRQEMEKKGQSADGKNKDKGGCGAVLDAGAPGTKDRDAKNANAERDWESNVRMAIHAAKQHNAGNLPAFLERLAGELKAPKVSWRQLLRNLIDGCCHKDYSYSRPNRRSAVLHPMVFPGLVPDALHKLVCFMDVSGSVSDSLMDAMANEVGGALDDGVADQLILAYIDTKIKKVDEYIPGDIVKADCPHGGGTDFRPAFDWLTKNHSDASCVIYLTDMMPNSWDLPECDVPVFWAAWCPENMLRDIRVPYGTVIHIDGWDY